MGHIVTLFTAFLLGLTGIHTSSPPQESSPSLWNISSRARRPRDRPRPRLNLVSLHFFIAALIDPDGPGNLDTCSLRWKCDVLGLVQTYFIHDRA